MILTYAIYNIPNSSSSPLLSVSLSGGVLVLTWPTIANQYYQVETKTNLTDASWSPLGLLVLAPGGVLSFTNNLPAAPQQFYRIAELP